MWYNEAQRGIATFRLASKGVYAMDVNVEEFLEKIREIAAKTTEAATLAAGMMGERANAFMSNTKSNLKIFDLNSECEAIFKDIGRMVYDMHRGVEVLDDAMEAKISELDAKQAEISALKKESEKEKFTVICPECGKMCAAEDAYCSGCGSKL